MRYAFFGWTDSPVCVKGLNNVNRFCTEVEKHMFLTVWQTSAITTQTPHSAATQLLWCSKLYITWMLWTLGIWTWNQNMIFATDYAWQKSFVVIANVCHYVIFLLFSNSFSYFQPDRMSTENKIQRGCFQMTIFNVHAFFFSTRPKEKYEAHQYYNIFPFKQTKTLTLTGLHCRWRQTLSYAVSTQNQWFWIKNIWQYPVFFTSGKI